MWYDQAQMCTERCSSRCREFPRCAPARSINLTSFAVLFLAVIAHGSVRTKKALLMGAVYVQAAAIMDRAARTVLQLLLRGIGLRSDALSGALDDVNLSSTMMSSCELHVAGYRGPARGEEQKLASAGLARSAWVHPRQNHCGSLAIVPGPGS